MNEAHFVGNTIRSLRKEQNLTGVELSSKAGVSQSKLSKIEMGNYPKLQAAEIDRILYILAAPKTIRQQVALKLLDAKQPTNATFKKHDVAFGDDLKRFMAEEQAAINFRVYLPNAVPSLLQTPDYRRSFLQQLDLSEAEITANMKQTFVRQDILWDERKKFHFVLNEQVLYGAIGGKSAHIAQLDRLERLARMKHITIGVIPTTACLPALETGPFVLLDDTKAIAALVVAELCFTDALSITQYAKLFAKLDHVACYGDEAAELIHQAIEHIR